MRSAVLLLLLLVLAGTPSAAEPSWSLLPNAPFRAFDRHEDMWFSSPTEGWVVNASGEVWNTPDAGETWELRANTGAYNRCVSFLNPEVGFVGLLIGREPIRRTTDGGRTWTPVADLPSSPIGICGMYAVKPNVVWAVGRYSGPATVLRTTDKGRSWRSFDVSDRLDGIVDCWFPEPHIGILAGTAGAFPNQARGVIVKTTDGGDTWETKHVSAIPGEWCWKISFPTDQTGYVSMQRFGGVIRVLKTTDGGDTWTEGRGPRIGTDTEGIGFVDENLGWIGGFGNGGLRTTDGGGRWVNDGFARNLNRLRLVRPGLAFAVGDGVYRWSETAPASEPLTDPRPIGPNLRIAPNPFAGSTVIRFTTPHDGQQRVFVHDVTGRRVKTLRDAPAGAGEHSFRWDGTNEAGRRVPAGAYFIRLETESHRETRDVILVH